jgi:hypothetical protein
MTVSFDTRVGLLFIVTILGLIVTIVTIKPRIVTINNSPTLVLKETNPSVKRDQP